MPLRTPILLAITVLAFTLLQGFAPIQRDKSSDKANALVGLWTIAGADGKPSGLSLNADGSAALDGAAGTWRRFGSKKLRFKFGSDVERPTYTIKGTQLTIDWKAGTKTYIKVATGFPEIPPPLVVGSGGAKKPKGPAVLWKHPKGYFTCELPHRWRVEDLDDWLMVVDPGLAGKETLESIAFVGWGELDKTEKGKTPVQLMQHYEAAWLKELAADGLRLRKAKSPPRRVLVGDIPGAEQEWTGKAANGQKLSLWAGSIVKRDAFLYVAALAVEGKEPEYFPRAKELFLSVVPTPPERNLNLERLLAGRHIASTSNSSSGSSGSKYTFHGDGSVESFWFMSGPIGLDIAGASETEWGSYEVFGTSLYVYMKSGQIDGVVELNAQGAPVTLLIEGTRYSLQ